MARNASDQVDFDYEVEAERPATQPLDWARLLIRAALRRKIIFFSVFVMGCAAVFGYYKWKRPVYRVEGKIFAQRQQIVPSSVRSASDDTPSRTAWELVHRRENLIALVKVADLMAPADQNGMEGLRDKVKLTPDREDPLDRMVKILDKQLVVLPEEGTITISLDWPNPQQAYRLVDGALQNFIEARHVQEVTAIDEVISVLRAREAKAKEQLDRVTDDVRREAVEGTRDVLSPAPRPTVARGASEELVRLKSLLDAKTRAIEDVEDFRRRRLADLHAQLDEKQHTYSDAHPVVIQLKQDIEALSKESSQVEALRNEEVKLRKDYQSKLAAEGVSEAASAALSGSTGRGGGSGGAVRLRSSTTPVEDDERVRDARFQYQQIVERVNGAQLELDATRAAFKYRYNVIWPPQIPTDPVSPNPIKIFGAGLLAAFFFAMLVAALPDLRAGRIVVRWQVERALELPILGEVTRK